jgi:hypothetical protein
MGLGDPGKLLLVPAKAIRKEVLAAGSSRWQEGRSLVQLGKRGYGRPSWWHSHRSAGMAVITLTKFDARKVRKCASRSLGAALKPVKFHRELMTAAARHMPALKL